MTCGLLGGRTLPRTSAAPVKTERPECSRVWEGSPGKPGLGQKPTSRWQIWSQARLPHEATWLGGMVWHQGHHEPRLVLLRDATERPLPGSAAIGVRASLWLLTNRL